VSSLTSDSSSSRDPDGITWLDLVVQFGVLALLGTTTVGLGAALVGAMTPLAVASGLVVWMIVAFRAIRGRLFERVRWKLGAPAIIAWIVIAGVALLNMQYAAEHLLTDRDPGVYITSARWLASQGSLLVDGTAGAFSGVAGIDGASQGYQAIRSDGLLYSQFQHGLAVILAIGRWIGGDWLLLKSVGLLSGGVLATFFAFSRTVLRSWWALAATTTVAVNLVVLHFGRDAYSELLLMIFLYGGLWFLHRALSANRSALSFLAGLVLGGTAMVRIDAWMILAGLFAFLFFDIWSAGNGWRHRIETVTAPVVAGIVVTGGLGVIDLLVASPQYFRDLMPNLYRMAAVLAVVIGGGVVVSTLSRPWMWMAQQRVMHRRRIVGTGAAIFIVVGSAFLYFVRPVVLVERTSAATDVIEYLQRLQGIPIDGSRRYWEMSMQWQAWYLGILGLAIGVWGWAWSVREVVVGRLRGVGPFIFIFSLVTVAFLLRPANTPDHLWVMRRFLAVTIPGLILMAFILAESWLPKVKARWGSVAQNVGVVSFATAMLVPPAFFTAPLISSTTQVGMYGVTTEVCSTLGRDAAVLVISERLRAVYQPALRSFCEIPAAGAAELPSLETLEVVSDGWAASGRTLYVVTLPDETCKITPAFSRFIWYPSPERTLTRRPVVEVDLRFGVALYRATDFLDGDVAEWSQCVDPQS